MGLRVPNPPKKNTLPFFGVRVCAVLQQLTTQITLNQYSIQENDTIDLSLELKGGTGTTTTNRTEQPAMDSEESVALNDTQTIERKPIKRRASEAGVDIPESADGHLVNEATKKQCTLHESRSKDRRNHERT